MTDQLRVDPATIRISIRPCGELWTVKVQNRATPDMYISSTGEDPVDTMYYVLRKAAFEGMQGVRLG